MSSHSCPNCGAPAPSRGNVCSYCGSVLSIGWTSADLLPAASASDPSRSVMVLTCSYDGKGERYYSIWDGTTGDYYGDFILAAYYDFAKKDWFNPNFGGGEESVCPMQWMPLPDPKDPRWTPAEPPPQGICVLVSDQYDYENSVASARFSAQDDDWHAIALISSDPDSDDTVFVSHWMPLPEPPVAS